MLKGIPKNVSPDLLKILCEMGHSDEIVIADGNFPAVRCGQRVVRADASGGAEMLESLLTLIPLDTYAEQNLILMQLSGNDTIEPSIWSEYQSIAAKLDDNVRMGRIDRFAFYERAKAAFAVIATSEEATYANIILKKGVVK